MKHKGSMSDFTGIRDNELHRSFARQLKSGTYADTRSFYSNVVKTPCSRFWVSELRAAEVVSAMRRGWKSPKMLTEKRRMYEEICRRVETLLAEDPDQPLSRVVEQVVCSPAPEFYLTPETARKTIRRILREIKEERYARRDTNKEGGCL